jgi:hypothetical protein
MACCRLAHGAGQHMAWRGMLVQPVLVGTVPVRCWCGDVLHGDMQWGPGQAEHMCSTASTACWPAPADTGYSCALCRPATGWTTPTRCSWALGGVPQPAKRPVSDCVQRCRSCQCTGSLGLSRKAVGLSRRKVPERRSWYEWHLEYRQLQRRQDGAGSNAQQFYIPQLLWQFSSRSKQE